MYNLTISVDDVHPQVGWRIIGDQTGKWFEQLNDEYGVKFTLFIPSNYHMKYPLSRHFEWVNELLSVPYFELAAHGHFHQTLVDKAFGECEFAEIQTEKDCDKRLQLLLDEWQTVGYFPKGWRNPGWLAHPNCIKILSEYFEYAAIHYEHNRGLVWDCKTFFGHDGIDSKNVSIHNENTVMLQSHIAGNWNDNVWNESNYDNTRRWLDYLEEGGGFIGKTIGEL